MENLAKKFQQKVQLPNIKQSVVALFNMSDFEKGNTLAKRLRLAKILYWYVMIPHSLQQPKLETSGQAVAILTMEVWIMCEASPDVLNGDREEEGGFAVNSVSDMNFSIRNNITRFLGCFSTNTMQHWRIWGINFRYNVFGDRGFAAKIAEQTKGNLAWLVHSRWKWLVGTDTQLASTWH